MTVMEPELLLGVASYTEPVGHAPGAHGAGLTVLAVDLNSGDVSTRYEYRGPRNPAFFCAHPQRPVLYVLSEVYDGPGTVTAVEFGDGYREVVRWSEMPSGGPVPSYVSLYDPSTLLLANYADEALIDSHGNGSLVSFRLDRDGHIVRQLSRVLLSGAGPHPQRQRGAHPHCVIRHPGNGFVYAADLGADALLQLRSDDGVLTPRASVPTRPGSGPRQLTFTPDGTQALVVHELSAELEVFPVGADGSLGSGTLLPLLRGPADPRSRAAEITCTRDGRRAFVSTRYSDSVVTFDADGGWHPVAWTGTGRVPRSITLTPDEQHLIVGNQDSDSVDVLRVDADGSLAHLLSIPLATPALVRVLPSVSRPSA